MVEEMNYRRMHVRVPIKGEALLKSDKGTYVVAKAIDISKGGVAIAAPSKSLDEHKYHITITTTEGKKIDLTARLIRKTETVVAFQTSRIDVDSLEIITDLVFRYQETPEFIQQIQDHNLYNDRYLDEDGNEIDITFDVDPEKE